MNKTEAIRALDYRVTQLEALAAKSQVTINPDKITLVDMDTGERVTRTPRSKPADVALTPPRPWCVGDVVRLARYETETDGLSWLENEAHLVGTEQKITNIHKDGDIWLSAGTNWPASALTLIRPAAQWVPNVGERVVLLDEANDNPVRRSWVGTFGHINLPEREDGMCRLDLENGEKNIYWAKNHLHPAAPVDDAADLRAENARLVAERENLRGAMAAQDGRERAAGEKCGVSYELHGCDWPDAVAEEVLAVRRERDAALAERDHHKQALEVTRALLDDCRTERDALRARIEAGRVMYGGMYGHQNKFEMWTFEHVYTDTMTARLIDIAPIADAGEMADERKGERRKGKDTLSFICGTISSVRNGKLHPVSRRPDSDRRTNLTGTRAMRGKA